MEQLSDREFTNDKNGNLHIILPNPMAESGFTSFQIPSSILLAGLEYLANKNQANGYVGLDALGKIENRFLNDSLLGRVEYKGTWNATTNTPTLPAANISKGFYYICTVAGTYNTIDFDVKDWVISDGVNWDIVVNSESVPSVFDRVGPIYAENGDYNADQITETDRLFFTLLERQKLASLTAETATTIRTKLGITTLSGSNTGDQDLSGLALSNHNHNTVYEPIRNANQQYITPTQLVNIGNLSGINSGNQVADGTTIIGSGTALDPFRVVVTGTGEEIIECYVVGSTALASDWLSLTVGGAALTPVQSVIYVILTAGEYINTTYRWSGSAYVSLSNPLSYASEAEAQAGSENTKVITPLRALQSFIYQAANYAFTALNTTSKNIVGAINELYSSLSGKANLSGADFTGNISIKGTSTGKTTLETANTSANNYNQQLPAKNGVIANLDDITGKTISKNNTFDPAIVFDKDEKYFTQYTQTGVLTISVGSNSNGYPSFIYALIATNGDNIIFPDLWIEKNNEYFNNEDYLYELKVWYNGRYSYELNQVCVLDISVPTLTSADIISSDLSILNLGFSEAVNIDLSGWSIATDGASLSISSIIDSGTAHPKFQLSRDVSDIETITISYDSGIGATTDIYGNELASITDYTISINSYVNSKSLSITTLNNHVEIASHTDFDMGNGIDDYAFIISAWVYLAGATINTIFNRLDSLFASTQLSLKLDGSNKLFFLIRDQVNVKNKMIKYNTGLPLNQWLHIVASYDASKNIAGMKLAINGAIVSTTIVSETVGYVAMSAINQKIDIGLDGETSTYSNMKIDNLALYKGVSIDSTLLNELYNGGLPVSHNVTSINSYLKLWHDFNDSLLDLSGNGHTATCVTPSYDANIKT